MSNKPSLPKGTRDFGPIEVAKRKYILNTIETVFKKYGFMPIETPTMENLSTLQGKYGDEGDQLLFKILNSGDYLKELKEYNDKGLAHEEMDKTFLPSYTGKLSDLDSKSSIPFISEKGLRYDLTVPFARYVVMHQNDITFPFKRYQMQPVWRADRPQKGRYREFWQCDADVVGSDSLLNELDLIQIYHEAFIELGIKNYELRINNRKILAGIAEVIKADDKLIELTISLDKIDKIGFEGVCIELKEKGFDDTQLKLLSDILFVQADSIIYGDNLSKVPRYIANISALYSSDFVSSNIFLQGLKELEFICNTVHRLNSSVNIKIDLSLARGLSYYTGCIFEVVSTEGSLKSSIGGGGRYDNLTGIFGLPNVSGVGISFGLDRIYDVMDELKLFPSTITSTHTKVLFCCFDAASQQFALSCLKKLRDENIASEIYPDLKKIGKQLDYANALQIPYACIIGDNEMQSGKLVLKNLQSGTQQELSIEEIITLLNR
jgi:histidyl-tRNA synthetase